MSNAMGKLNTYLFDQLERLNDGDLAGDALKDEIERARAVSGVAQQVISNANTVLRTVELADMRGTSKGMPNMLTGGEL